MPLHNKLLFGAVGVAGASVVAWRSLFPWIGYDLDFIIKAGKLKKLLEKYAKENVWIIDLFEKNASESPQKPFIIFEDRIYTYEFVNQQANRVANIVLEWKLKVVDTIAIMIYNSPEFIWTFLGLQKLGLGVSFINYNLHGKSLEYCIAISEANALIIGAGIELFHAVDEIKDDLDDLPIYVQGLTQSQLLPGYQSWDDLMYASLPVPVCKDVRAGVNIRTPCCYIFTSGTTGLPKPVIIYQQKALSMASFMQIIGFCTNDIIYTPLPLYHSSGSGLGLFSAIYVGATIVLQKKFSAYHFWEDCRRHKVTVIQYIGEVCRYLLSTPKHPFDRKHSVRAAFGNGLRKDIWIKFQDRFGVPFIAEFFGSTEGPTASVNLANRVGSCGRLSPFINLISPFQTHLVKYDVNTGLPLRNKDGHCMKIKPGETGLMITEFQTNFKDGIVYKGGKEINEKKFVRDVLKNGDLYFNFGDIMYLDKDYFLYFHDRIGDTFRWKGENVATLEIANTLTSLPFVVDANVYGVHFPGSEGRCGMATIHLNAEQEMTLPIIQAIYDKCEKSMPKYARPIFLRFSKQPDLTSTFKHRKTELMKEGFDPNKISDPLFYRNEKENTYSPLTVSSYSQLLELRSKL